MNLHFTLFLTILLSQSQAIEAFAQRRIPIVHKFRVLRDPESSSHSTARQSQPSDHTWPPDDRTDEEKAQEAAQMAAEENQRQMQNSGAPNQVQFEAEAERETALKTSQAGWIEAILNRSFILGSPMVSQSTNSEEFYIQATFDPLFETDRTVVFFFNIDIRKKPNGLGAERLVFFSPWASQCSYAVAWSKTGSAYLVPKKKHPLDPTDCPGELADVKIQLTKAEFEAWVDIIVRTERVLKNIMDAVVRYEQEDPDMLNQCLNFGRCGEVGVYMDQFMPLMQKKATLRQPVIHLPPPRF